ncbi:MAG: BREX system ATP-binding domain-containing protein, partial [candidate division WOR-3 bacterium]
MINKELAKAIVHKLGSYGTPPEFGLEYYTVGLEKYLEVIEEEYFKDYLKLKLSSFKLIVGNYGGGKTHFLYCLRKKAMENNYLTSYVSLSPVECPFDKLELVYKVIALNLMAPKISEEISFDTFYYERGIDNVIKLWYQKIKEQVSKKEDFYSYLEGLSGIES